jgi:D-sedoheptulose 7-phosphate isomerase
MELQPGRLKMDKRALLEKRVREHVAVASNMFDNSGEDILKLFDICVESLRKGGKIILFGNGGSASQAEHIAGELVGKFYKIRKALPAIALSTNTAIITAVANDISFDEVFSRQVEALGRKGDVAIGLSTSGNSKNVINAIEKANEIGLFTVAFTGETGGKLKGVANLCIRVPSKDVPRIQEMHIFLGHILCEVIEEALS